jgi:hypothetical protein
MKIKYFNGEIDVKNSEELGDYFIDELGYANETIVQAYADLIFKIHEKIEEYQIELDVIKHETKDEKAVLFNVARIQELKSLLENEE